MNFALVTSSRIRAIFMSDAKIVINLLHLMICISVLKNGYDN